MYVPLYQAIKMCKLLISVVVSLLLLTTSGSHAQHDEGETTSSETCTVETKATPPCARSLEDLRHSIEETFPENYTVYLNCMSFDGEGALRTAIASGELTGDADLRYLIKCRGNVLVAQSTAGLLDRTNMETGCLECNNTATQSCVNECAPECERCYGTVGKCTRCTACTSGLAEECRYESGHTLECATQCPVSPLDNTVSAFTINHEEYNYCECAAPSVINLNEYPAANAEAEVECEEGEEEEPLPSSCDATCRLGPGHERNNESNICFACGIANCVRCVRNPNRCTECLRDTVLYADEHGEAECFACPLAEIAHKANLQEEKLHEEEEEQRERTIALAVSLPIVLVVLIVVFVSMFVVVFVCYRNIKKTSEPGVNDDKQPAAIESYALQ
ncbi:uncharacterized protein LOC135351039 isoform X2 [Halichondria panicea]|uniref:uncharacterized protein LOC135351039 isoform X2 n=1 Tax=Halichondria panicea TaxID=6063 RepID=UPI00312BB9F6